MIPSRIRGQGKRLTVLTYWTDEKTNRWKWRKPVQGYNEQDKRRVIQKVLQIMIDTAFGNHFYKWDGRIKIQRSNRT